MNSRDLFSNLSQAVRNYAMYVALGVIALVFGIATGGTFLSSRNIADLLNQTGYVAVLAVGMTLVIVIRHIDLSVGFLAGFLGAVAAIAMEHWGLPSLVTIALVLALGTLIGLGSGAMVALLGIPSFVATLAGWLIWRGALLLVTGSTGTIIISDPLFNAIGNDFIPDLPFPAPGGVHGLTWLLGLAWVAALVGRSWLKRRRRQASGFEVPPFPLWLAQNLALAALMLYLTSILAESRGASWTFVVMLVVMLVFTFLAESTVLGRHIYAVGGNPEAAELSGISVQRISLFVFGSMGFLSALSGILFASRLRSASPQAGTLFELDAIAAAYIGGVSASGGVGKIPSSIVGALVYMSLMNGMNLLGTDQALQYIIRAVVLLAAVAFDVLTRRVGR